MLRSLAVTGLVVAAALAACGGKVASEASSGGSGTGSSGGASSGSSSGSTPVGPTPTSTPPSAPPPSGGSSGLPPPPPDSCPVDVPGASKSAFPNLTFALPDPPCPQGMQWNGTQGGFFGFGDPTVYTDAAPFVLDFCTNGGPTKKPFIVDWSSEDVVAFAISGKDPSWLVSVDGAFYAGRCEAGGPDSVAFYVVPKGARLTPEPCASCAP